MKETAEAIKMQRRLRSAMNGCMSIHHVLPQIYVNQAEHDDLTCSRIQQQSQQMLHVR